MNVNEIQFADPSPWPPVCVTRPSRLYAREMLSNIGSCDSEMTAVCRYIYDNIILSETHPDLALCFHKISVVEMHHLNIFGQLVHLLGADPRLWHSQNCHPSYWSPACVDYVQIKTVLLQNAIHAEEETIKAYHLQATSIEDDHIVALLDRIILDEEIHVEIFRTLLESR